MFPVLPSERCVWWRQDSVASSYQQVFFSSLSFWSLPFWVVTGKRSQRVLQGYHTRKGQQTKLKERQKKKYILQGRLSNNYVKRFFFVCLLRRHSNFVLFQRRFYSRFSTNITIKWKIGSSCGTLFPHCIKNPKPSWCMLKRKVSSFSSLEESPELLLPQVLVCLWDWYP